MEYDLSCSVCFYKFNEIEISYERYFVCGNIECLKILCIECNELNRLYLDDVDFSLVCNCPIMTDNYIVEEEFNRMEIITDDLTDEDDEEEMDYYYADF